VNKTFLYLSAACLLGMLPFASSAATLRFCLLETHMPMSSRQAVQGTEAGVDVELARALASEMGRGASFSWQSSAHDAETALKQGQCDVIPSALAETGTLAGPPLTSVQLTRPYYAGAYWIVRAADASPLRVLGQARDTRLAVEGDSVVAYTLRHQGQKVQVMFNAEAIIEALANGKITYGYLWGPVAAWQLRDHKQVVLAPEFQPEERWDFALAVRQDDTQLLQKLNTALTRLINAGEVEAAFRRYSLPYLPPKEA
jgi:ABC-type amino acid transport substrate-binding protein